MKGKVAHLKGTKTQHSGYMDQTRLVVEIYSKSRVRAIAKIAFMKFG